MLVFRRSCAGSVEAGVHSIRVVEDADAWRVIEDLGVVHWTVLASDEQLLDVQHARQFAAAINEAAETIERLETEKFVLPDDELIPALATTHRCTRSPSACQQSSRPPGRRGA